MMGRKDAKDIIKGISVCNPVDVDKDYLLFTVEYAARKEFNHLQIIGPIHDGVKGNIDGMTLYRKYSRFNNEKCLSYIEQAMDAINAACKKTVKYGIKTYVWHHELELPTDFKGVYPEVANSCGDIEVTHPRVKDFLEHKIKDFFYAYPDIDGMILTLHETKVPLLKLKDQKLGKIERVKYVTKILYDACQALGKELIVRPFASLEEDYIMMTQAYEEISAELLIMDKWTQFDWSLFLPNNAFYHKIKNNPLFVEADIFGEYFGKGRLPLMLKEHIAEKFAYCKEFSPKGYVARIDRAGEIPFGDVNEVNIVITHAHLNQMDVEKQIDEFFQTKYGEAAIEVRSIMEQTEDILRRTIYAKGYYFTELSFFPTLNHCKNHYYFEMMRENCNIASNEWYIPRDWERGSLAEFLEEKKMAVSEAAQLYERVLMLQDKIDKDEYEKLWVKFCNLKLVAEIWMTLTTILMDYVKYFETRDDVYEISFEKDIEILLERNQHGIELLGEQFYCLNAVEMIATGASIEEFVKDIRESFRLEKNMTERIEKESDILDYVVCGGAMESHGLQKEVNFSDVLVRDDALCRIPGNYRGAQWSCINAHGWFSYEVQVKPHAHNMIRILMEGVGDELNVCVHVGEQEYTISEMSAGRKEYSFPYVEEKGESSVKIRFDKISGHTPCVYWIKVQKMYSPDGGHELIGSRKPKLAFDENGDFRTQQKQIKDKLVELLGEMPKRVDLNPVIEYQRDMDTYTEYRISFDVEAAVQAVCLLCIPKLGKKKYPLVICLQGHGKGMQVSMGRPYGDDPADTGDRNIAIQALERGYAALCLEQRGMGERRTIKTDNKEEILHDNGRPRCHVTSMNALLLGRTMIGERCWDISRAIDLALTFPEIDGDQIICTGNSGGGTATYYAACMDERIKVAMPSCAVCTFKDSIEAMTHCVCNFVPHLAKYMDMGDMAAAIAPRKLIVINGKDDPIFPEAGVKETFDTIESVYRAAGAPGNCTLVTGNGGHRYYKKEAWEAFDSMVCQEGI